MARRRLFSLDVVDTDSFLEMPGSTQALYFHLGMRADDDGFVANPKRTVSNMGASLDDLKLLVAKGFVIPFPSGICVIRDWRINNTIQKDRYKPTIYAEEKAMLETTSTNRYFPKDTACIQNVSILETQYKLSKDNIIQDNNYLCGELSSTEQAMTKPRKPKNFIPPTLEEVEEYVQERGSNVNAQGFIDFYESKGWMIGKAKMKDWKAACRRAEKWESNRRTDIRNPKDYEYKGGSL